MSLLPKMSDRKELLLSMVHPSTSASRRWLLSDDEGHDVFSFLFLNFVSFRMWKVDELHSGTCSRRELVRLINIRHYVMHASMNV
jgi:hypothetical protein